MNYVRGLYCLIVDAKLSNIFIPRNMQNFIQSMMLYCNLFSHNILHFCMTYE